jgi:transposase
MEATGVYGIPLSEILAARGVRVSLINAHPVQHVPGRQSAVKDYQWIQHLYTCGLLRASCRPAAEMCAWRASVRHRATCLAYRAAHSQHRHTALQQMHVHLTQVVSEITGATGLALMPALVAGEREPVQLARSRDPRGVSRTAERAKALTGHERPAQVFALTSALALYDTYPAPVRACDRDIAQHVHTIRPAGPDALPSLERMANRLSPGKKGPIDEARTRLDQLTGVDLEASPGLQASPVPTLLSERGLDLRQWPNAKAFCAWWGWAPVRKTRAGTSGPGAR